MLKKYIWTDVKRSSWTFLETQIKDLLLMFTVDLDNLMKNRLFSAKASC